VLPRYEIRVAGHIDDAAAEAFAGLEVLPADDFTRVRGRMDQAALHGLLERIRRLGLELIDVRRARPQRSRPNTQT
jgi:hypothetical protein